MMGTLTDKQVELLSVCFDNDPKKIEAFLNFLTLVSLGNVKMPNMKMVLEEEDNVNLCCIHENNNTCLLDFPDSVRKCKKPCTFYKGVIR